MKLKRPISGQFGNRRAVKDVRLGQQMVSLGEQKASQSHTICSIIR